MKISFDISTQSFIPNKNLINSQVLSFTLKGEKHESSNIRDIFLQVIQYYYLNNKWDIREVMIKKHGFLQAYFYQDINSKNSLKVSDGIYMREISYERSLDLLIKTLVYMKEDKFEIEIQ